MDIRIQRGNLSKAVDPEHRPLIRGIGCGTDGRVYIDYKPMAGPGARSVLVVEPGFRPKVYHTCQAVRKATPCWHLGIVALALEKDPPLDVELEISNIPSPTNVFDLSTKVLDHTGDFEVLTLAAGAPPEDDEVFDEPFVPDWISRYGFPAKLRKKIAVFRSGQEERLTEEQKSRIPNARYIPSGSELVNAVSALLYNGGWEAPLLVGPKGSGKSTMAETLAAVMMLPVNKVFGGIDLNCEALLGARTLVPSDNVDLVTEAKLRAACKNAEMDPEPLVQRLRGSQMQVGFDPGILLQSVERGELVIVDEVNMLIPEVTSLLHGLLDWQKILPVPGYGTVKAPHSFRLIACMNFGYSGTKPLNEAFQDRFRSVKAPHLSENQLSGLIMAETGCKESAAAKLSGIFHKLAEGVANGDISERVLSIRSLFRAAREEMDGCGVLRAVTASVLTEGLADEFEIKQVTDIIEACIV